MNLPRARHKLTSLILGGLGALLAAGLGEYLQFFRNMEFTSYDLRVAAASPTPRDDRIVHLNIGDISVRPDQLGRWPWHRDVHARIVDGLTALGAEQIIFDVEFLEPERAYLDPDTAPDVELAAQLLVAVQIADVSSDVPHGAVKGLLRTAHQQGFSTALGKDQGDLTTHQAAADDDGAVEEEVGLHLVDMSFLRVGQVLTIS